jgi:3-oxoacyl-[acyl-carrier protein] reductase
MGQIEGQVAITTGGGEGLGEGIARRFAREGAIVLVVDSNATEAARVAAMIRASGGTAHGIMGDMAEAGVAEAIVADALRVHHRIDILVNAQVPVTRLAMLEAKPAADFIKMLTGTTIAAVLAMQAVFPRMKAAGGGRIVNVGLPYGANAHEAISDAVVADGALIALTRAAGFEWAQHNVLVNFLQAGAADIPAFHTWRDQRHDDRIDRLIAAKPMPRLADPVEDVGGAAMLLVSDEGCFIVGHRIMADGGQHLAAAVFEPGTTRYGDDI